MSVLRPILVVDDNEDDVFLMQHALKKAGVYHPVNVAQDGQEAIDLLTRGLDSSQGLPCFVLLDLKMPRVPGLEVLEWIRKEPRLSTLPVVVLTSSSAEADVQAAYRAGANSYFAKPSDSEELLKLITLLDEYWLKCCIRPPMPQAPHE